MTTVQPKRVAALIERAEREVAEGVLPSCQLALAYDGEVVAAATFGEARDTTRYLVFSISKGVMAGAVWLLMSDGLLDPTAPVVTYLADFGTLGKERVTVEQLLLHTAGFPYAWVGPPDWSDGAARRAAYTRWHLDFQPGTAYTYHAFAAHWVLADIVEVLTGTDYRDFVRGRLCEPLGLSGLRMGLPESEQHDIATLVLFGEMATSSEYAAADMFEPPPSPRPDDLIQLLNTAPFRSVGIPAAGVLSGATDLALYYQGLLHNPDGMWSPEVLGDGTGVVRNTYPDPGQGGIPANRTRGLVVAGDDGHAWRRVNFGRTVSPRTFGHDGAFGQIAWADPASGLSFAYLTNGLDRHNVRLGHRGLDLSGLAGLCTTP